jgi:hypothetical protein
MLTPRRKGRTSPFRTGAHRGTAARPGAGGPPAAAGRAPPAAAASASASVRSRRPGLGRGRAPADRHAPPTSGCTATTRGCGQAFGCIVPTLKRISGLQHETASSPRPRRLRPSSASSSRSGSWPMPGSPSSTCAAVRLVRLRDLPAAVRRVLHGVDPLGGQDGRPSSASFRSAASTCWTSRPAPTGARPHRELCAAPAPRPVRRKSYAGALFDVEDTVAKWVEVELRRFREGRAQHGRRPHPVPEGGGLPLQLGRSRTMRAAPPTDRTTPARRRPAWSGSRPSSRRCRTASAAGPRWTCC